MPQTAGKWDYLIVTASNKQQAVAYKEQLDLRRRLGFLSDVKNVVVVADPDGKRIGSGASTILCFLEVLNSELEGSNIPVADAQIWAELLSKLRILIVHGGGDSKRLPAYGPCGKLFIPIPGQARTAVPLTLFDRQIATYLSLPSPPGQHGQIVITSGDVLLRFDPSQVQFKPKGMTGLGCYVSPELASGHGVYCLSKNGHVRQFLQKPIVAEQAFKDAINHFGQTVVDIGVMSFDAETATKLLRFCGTTTTEQGHLAWSAEIAQVILTHGLDFYREIACALGSDITEEDYIAAVKKSGSTLQHSHLQHLFKEISDTPFSVRIVPGCGFLHFGTVPQIISGGVELQRSELGLSQLNTSLSINNEVTEAGSIVGSNCWIESCRISAKLALGGENLIAGVDIDESLSLPPKACLDILEGHDRSGQHVWFVRCYGTNDRFKSSLDEGIVFCGRDMLDWLYAARACPDDVWDNDLPPQQRTLWNARLFCAQKNKTEYRNSIWMFNPEQADEQDLRAWKSDDRYSFAEIASMASHKSFYKRRYRIHAENIHNSLRTSFTRNSEFSAAELAYVLRNIKDPTTLISDILVEARWFCSDGNATGLERFIFPRIIHTLGSAISMFISDSNASVETELPELPNRLSPSLKQWLNSMGLTLDSSTSISQLAHCARSLAFKSLGQVIITSGGSRPDPPRNVLRSDEIVWGRAPARLDIAGGWTDTPPYSLEYGGCVVNTAVDLNGQPPIQAFARVIDDPLIRIGSIDQGTRTEVTSLDELLDYSSLQNEHVLAKAALALVGFSPSAACWPENTTLQQMLEMFGGGIELTTLAAIPKGSGLGTSSIMGAVLLAVITKVMGRKLTQRELFHAVLRLEQAMKTGGGWQDQIGGTVGETKIIFTEPGLIPDAKIHYLPTDLLDPKRNVGQTLLYYTGITRLAKNILQQVVSVYLNRDRRTMTTLKQIHDLPNAAAYAISRKDLSTFGHVVGTAWQLNKQLDPSSTNTEVDTLLSRIQQHVFGAKLLGAGGGGFLLMVCKSPKDAERLRTMLESEPPNDRARFFDYDINPTGLVVTVC